MSGSSFSKYFTGVATKRLRQVEVDPKKSNQHEFNGVNDLRSILGDSSGGTVHFDAAFLYLCDDESLNESALASVSWYDSRKGNPDRAPEYRLYYPCIPVMEHASVGDLLVVARRPNNSLLILIADQGSTAESQILRLFGIVEAGARFEIMTRAQTDRMEVGYIEKVILRQIGVEVEDLLENQLDRMLREFSGAFPSTKVFSEYARRTLKDVRAADNPDLAIVTWMEREEVLFRTLERHFVAERIAAGFGTDVDGFLQYSLSVQNRRKARAGQALENHLEVVFQELGVKYTRAAKTENNSRPDYLFPGEAEYHSPAFPDRLLSVLGVKSTCKDRWRQVLAEAKRISQKHLFTLEPAISLNQTNEMYANNLLLVIPRSLHATFLESQRTCLLTLGDFVQDVLSRQNSATA